MKYQNPIISGFHPDPSVCRVGKDYYLVNSTFEYFPGIPVYHSTDLVNWEQIGHCLTRNSQLKLVNGAPNCLGIYAPTIRYSNGTFYCIVTNVADDSWGGNFIVWTKDPYGEWSEPIQLGFKGIDPSLFFDDDGKVYYTGTDYNVYACELDIETGKAVGEVHYVWNGSGANNPEGPHLYKINGTYYLMIAEGGTELGHMVTIARSSSVFGPYEACPNNPVLTNRGTGLPIKAVGHADLVDDENGNWWAVCLANRPISYPFRHSLGRETMLVPVKWENGWPVMGVNGHVEEEIEVEAFAGEKTPDTGRYVPGSDMRDDFKGAALHPSWNYIYNPVEKLVELTGGGLALYGNACALSGNEPKAIICRRQEHFDFTASAEVDFMPSEDGDEAGIAVYMNNRHHYEAVVSMRDGRRCVIISRRIGLLTAVEKVVPCDCGKLTLVLKGTREWFGFSFIADGIETELGGGEASYLTTEVGGCFTGNYIALYASGNGHALKTPAVFSSFEYKAD